MRSTYTEITTINTGNLVASINRLETVVATAYGNINTLVDKKQSNFYTALEKATSHSITLASGKLETFMESSFPKLQKSFSTFEEHIDTVLTKIQKTNLSQSETGNGIELAKQQIAAYNTLNQTLQNQQKTFSSLAIALQQLPLKIKKPELEPQEEGQETHVLAAANNLGFKEVYALIDLLVQGGGNKIEAQNSVEKFGSLYNQRNQKDFSENAVIKSMTAGDSQLLEQLQKADNFVLFFTLLMNKMATINEQNEIAIQQGDKKTQKSTQDILSAGVDYFGNDVAVAMRHKGVIPFTADQLHLYNTSPTGRQTLIGQPVGGAYHRAMIAEQNWNINQQPRLYDHWRAEVIRESIKGTSNNLADNKQKDIDSAEINGWYKDNKGFSTSQATDQYYQKFGNGAPDNWFGRSQTPFVHTAQTIGLGEMGQGAVDLINDVISFGDSRYQLANVGSSINKISALKPLLSKKEQDKARQVMDAQLQSQDTQKTLQYLKDTQGMAVMPNYALGTFQIAGQNGRLLNQDVGQSLVDLVKQVKPFLQSQNQLKAQTISQQSGLPVGLDPNALQMGLLKTNGKILLPLNSLIGQDMSTINQRLNRGGIVTSTITKRQQELNDQKNAYNDLGMNKGGSGALSPFYALASFSKSFSTVASSLMTSSQKNNNQSTLWGGIIQSTAKIADSLQFMKQFSAQDRAIHNNQRVTVSLYGLDIHSMKAWLEQHLPSFMTGKSMDAITMRPDAVSNHLHQK